MHTVLSIINITVCLVISLTCGIVMGRKRKEASDRSRLFLAIFNLQVAALPSLDARTMERITPFLRFDTAPAAKLTKE